jgi:uncharacterized protein DUF4160
MAVLKHKCGDAVIRIKDADHYPPHCHVQFRGRDVKVKLQDLEPLSTIPLPHAVKKYLRENQEQLLAAWERVRVVPTGGAWEFEE